MGNYVGGGASTHTYTYLKIRGFMDLWTFLLLPFSVITSSLIVTVIVSIIILVIPCILQFTEALVVCYLMVSWWTDIQTDGHQMRRL